MRPFFIHGCVVLYPQEASPEASVEPMGTGDALRVSMPVADAATLLQTKFFHFVHPATGRKMIAQMGAMSIPTELASAIEFIEGVSLFHPPHYRRQTPNAAGFAIPPQTIYNIYQVPPPAATFPLKGSIFRFFVFDPNFSMLFFFGFSFELLFLFQFVCFVVLLLCSTVSI